MSLFAGAGAQFFNNSGSVLSGGLIYTYLAGTSTPEPTYTTSTGNIAHSNPIVLDSAGRVNEVWVVPQTNYKFILRDSTGSLIATYDNVPGTVSSADLANTSNVALGDALVGFRQSNSSGNVAGSVGRTVHQKFQEMVNVLDFGADPTGTSDSTSAIQAALNYAASLVQASPDGIGDAVNGINVVMQGVFNITQPLVMNTSNVCLVGQGGATIMVGFTSQTGYNGAKPALILGTGTLWQTSGNIGAATKYNSVSGIIFKRDRRVANNLGYIGILVSGTRNATVRNCLVETGFAGLFLENSSEFYSDQFSCIGSTYGIVMDNRGDRSAANSVLNVANTDNDVSSNKIDMATVYYSQHTGVLAINTGSTDFNGMTVGIFSDNPSGSSPGLGFPASYAGFHVWGADSKWTRAMLLDSIVFEAKNNVSRTCIRIESDNQNCPVQGVTMNNIHIQTYASDPVGGVLTLLLEVIQSGDGDVHNILLSNSGFTYQSAGRYTGTMCNVIGLAGVRFENCYPASAFVLSNLGYYGNISPLEVVEHTDIDAFPPTGWTAGGVTTGCSKVGGSSGVVPYLEFTGDTGAMYVEKTFDLLQDVPQIKSVFISFLAFGNADLWCVARVNGASDTDSNIINGTNQERYGQAIVPNTVNVNGYRRLVFCFNPFSANFGFNTVRFQIGRGANATAATLVRIQDIRVGYFVGDPVPYNPFS
jgi:hypothetical protein